MDETTTEAGALETLAFCIASIERAEWLLRKLANNAAETARIKAQADRMITEIEADDKQLRYLFGDQLEAFAREELAQRGNRRRSLTFLQGTCTVRTVPESVKVSDAEVAMEYAKANGLPYVTTLEKLETSAYREAAQRRLDSDGELMPGVEVQPEREVFRISFGNAGE